MAKNVYTGRVAIATLGNSGCESLECAERLADEFFSATDTVSAIGLIARLPRWR